MGQTVGHKANRGKVMAPPKNTADWIPLASREADEKASRRRLMRAPQQLVPDFAGVARSFGEVAARRLGT